MRSVNVTFSIPENINIALHCHVEKRGLSRFVASAIEAALLAEQNALKASFREAENDPDLKETMDDWATLDGEDWDA